MKKNFLGLCFRDFIDLIYPETCVACGIHLTRLEKTICTACLYNLPVTKFHTMKDNPVEQVFWGRTDIFSATAFCYFVKDGKLQKILHALKYLNRQDVGEEMGRQFGNVLLESDRFCTIDAIVPVPLHPKKQRLRGYNQSLSIATGLSQSLNTEVKDALKRVLFNPTQTKKGRYERWENVAGIFELNPEYNLQNMHVLLVDDVMTTGSTLEAAIVALQKIPNIKVSLGVLGLA